MPKNRNQVDVDLLNLAAIKEPAQLQAEIGKLGISPDNANPVDAYWRVAMAALEKEYYNLAQAAIQPEIPGAVVTPDLFMKFKKNVEKITWNDSDMTLSPSKFISKFFAGLSLVDATSGSGGKQKTVRDLYERISPTSQCAAVEKRFVPVIDWNICYICGTEILDRYNPRSPGNNGGTHPHSSRQCEHVLPAFTALGYDGLIQTAKLPEVYDAEIEQFHRHEYAESHECCNQVKSDDLWITYSHNNGKYEIDDAALKSTLTEIKRASTHDCPNVDRRFTVNVRAEEIKRLFLTPLVTLINNQQKEWGDLFPLIIRIRQITALRVSIPGLANFLINGQTEVVVNTKTRTLDNAATFIILQFGKPDSIFDEMFEDMFKPIIDEIKGKRNMATSLGEINPTFVEELFTIALKMKYGAGRDLRSKSIPAIKKSLFDFYRQKIIEDRQKHTDAIISEVFKSGGDDVDESVIIPACNTHKGMLKLALKNEFIIQWVNPALEAYPSADAQSVQTRTQWIQAVTAKLGLYNQNADAATNNQIEEEKINMKHAIDSPPPANVVQIGGSKKKKSSQIYKRMIGGTWPAVAEDEYIKTELFDAIIQSDAGNLGNAISREVMYDLETVADRVHARTNRVQSTRVNMIPNTSGLPTGPFERGYSFISQGITKTVAERNVGGHPVMQNVGSNEIYPVDIQSRLFLADQKKYRFGGSNRKVKSNKRSNMNRKTRKNRFSLLGKRTPSARMPKTRTKTQSAKPKQRKNRTLRKKQK
jgi:hypothetical protein